MSTVTAKDTKISRLLRWEQGETPGPWELTVLPTNRCNLTCKHCWLRAAEATPDGVDLTQVPDERLLQLVEEAAALGVREWNFVGGGEPLLRGEIVLDMCRRIRELGMNGILHSNGTGITEKRLQTLIDIRWATFVLSLDGPNAEINDAIRGDRCFERAEKNMRKLAELKRAAGTTLPSVNLNMVVTNTNYHTIPDMIELCHAWDIAGMHASMLLDMNEDCHKFELNDAQRMELGEVLDRAIALADGYGIRHNFVSLKPLKHTLDQGVKERKCGGADLNDSMCYESWLGMTIVPDGQCGPCCVSYDLQANNINHASLEEVWLGPYMTDVRQRLKTRTNLMSYCAYCPSNIQIKTEEYRTDFVAAKTAPARRSLGYLTSRFGAELRTRGLRGTLQRTWEWVQIRRGMV
jgi:MoaA/NifB/PqqE/SkfB family radical SAM enzyme